MNDQVWIDYVAALIGFQMEILILSFTVLRYVNPLKDSQRFFSDFSNIVNKPHQTHLEPDNRNVDYLRHKFKEMIQMELIRLNGE